jgi:gliding motility-associated-like protein
MNSFKQMLLLLMLFISSQASSQVVSNVAGVPGVQGNNNGPAATATFNNPHGVAIDKQGNLYIANRFGHTIRKITAAGVVSTFAGSGNPGATDGTGTAASFNEPWAVACDTLGNVYVADTKNYKIRKISNTGVVTTLAGTGVFGTTNGPANVSQFGFPSGIAVTKDGSKVYVADRMTNVIRKIQNDSVITFAGTVFSPGSNDGQGTAANFDHPYGLTIDATGNILVADEFNNKIRRITPTGAVTTLAGNGTQGSVNGPALSSSFYSPWGVCVDGNGDVLVGDANNFTIRKISQGVVSVYAGQAGVPGMLNGPALQSTFNGVSSLWYNSNDNSVYVTDPYSQLVRKVAAESLTLVTSTGAVSFCTGAPVTLTASPSGLTNYVFRAGATIIGTSASGTITVNNLPQGTNNITCTATNAQGLPVASNVLSIDITAGLSVSVTTTGNSTICQGDTVTLTASPSGTYLWSNGATTASVAITNAGTYTVTVTNAQGCSGQSTPVDVVTLQPPAATAMSSISTPACAGDSVMLTAGAATTYLWSNGQTSQSIYVTAAGNYTVMVSNAAGCSAISLPVNVAYYSQANSSITPSGNILITQGSSVTLQAGTGTSYQWSTGATTQNITVSAPGNYVVTVTDNNGCLGIPDTVTVSYISASNIISVTGSTAFCDGETVALTSVFNSNNQWYLDGSIIPGANQQSYTASASGSYHVEHTPASGPVIISNPVQVTVYQRPGAALVVNDTVCKNEQANLSVSPQQGTSFVWYDAASGGTVLGNGLSLTTPSLTSSSTYYVESTNSNGCTGVQRTAAEAVVYATPLALIENTTPTVIGGAYEIYFSVQSNQNISSWYWDFGDPSSPDNTSTAPDPYHSYAMPGDYTITLEVTTENGCTEVFTKTLSVTLPNNLFIPTGFTPNNDGNNDLFRVRGHNILFSDISIYNQWGQRIWHSPKEMTGWDGVANGQKVPMGSYAYVIEVHFDNGKKEMHRGNINLIR